MPRTTVFGRDFEYRFLLSSQEGKSTSSSLVRKGGLIITFFVNSKMIDAPSVHELLEATRHPLNYIEMLP